MTPSSSSRMLQLGIICLCLLVGSLSSPLFKTSPNYNFYTGYGSGSAIKISGNEQYVGVGFTSGNFKIYDLYGNSIATCYGHSSKIIDIEWVSSSYGWITLDSSGKAVRWSVYGIQQFTWNFNTSVIDMSVTGNFGYYYVGFNFGNMVLEYYATTTYNTTVRTYTAPVYTTFTQIQYDSTYYQLYAATNTSYVQAYYCSNGAYASQFYISYPGKYFDLTTTGQLIVINSYYIYKFNSTSYYTYFTYSGSANTVAASYKDYSYQYVIVDTTYNSYMYVYDSSGYYEQNLNYMYYTIKGMDASNNYLVAVDSYGYLSINTYSNIIIDINFPVWAVVLIVVGSVLVCIVLIIMVAVRARKRRALLAANNYNNFDNQISPAVPYFAGNQGFNPNQNTNQGWNANQGPITPVYNSTNQNLPTNPYQANQPNTWA